MARRNALRSLFAFLPFGVSFVGFLGMGVKFITPLKREVERRIFTVNLQELPLNSTRKINDLQGKELMLVRTGEREVKAMSTSCTHLGCSVYWQQDKKQFYCPCHMGIFDKDGNVISGPPPRPMDSYRVELERDNVFIYFIDKESKDGI